MAMLMLTYNCNRNCPYCFEKDIPKTKSDFMNKENFLKILKWLKKNNQSSVILCGGEPTIHPNFISYYRLLDKLGFKISIFTNLIFPPELIQIFNSKNTTLLINFDAPEEYSKENYELLIRNLEELYKLKINCTLSFIMYKKHQSIKELIHYAKKFNLNIHFSFAKPTWKQQNKFVPTKNIPNFKNDLFNLLDECNKNNINIHFDCAMEKCLFTEDEIKKYDLYNKGLKYTCNSNFIINPDATISACPFYKILKNKTIFEFESIKEAQEIIKKDINELKKVPNMEKCTDCKYFSDHTCDGGCNAEKITALINKEYKII